MNGKRKREEKNSGSMQVTFLLIKKLFFLKNGPSPASFIILFGLFKQTLQFLQYMWKNVRPVAGTHDLLDVSLLP